MKRLDIKVKKIENPINSVIGFASVTIEDEMKDGNLFCFVIRNVQIIRNRDGVLFLGFPTRKDKNTSSGYSNLAFPANGYTRDYITSKVLEEFHTL